METYFDAGRILCTDSFTNISSNSTSERRILLKSPTKKNIPKNSYLLQIGKKKEIVGTYIKKK